MQGEAPQVNVLLG